jgi:hypothetical protein
MLRERPNQSTSDVAGVIREVRTRWRRKLLVRGGLQLLIGGAVLLIAAGFALEALRFTPTAILGFRIGTIAAILGLAAWTLGRPLLRQVSDEQVALYLEEHEPSLNTLLLSAMSAERNGNPQDHSPQLVQKLVEEAIVRCQAIDDGRGIEQPLVRRYGLMAAAAFAFALAVFTLGPAYLRQGLSAMFSWASVEAAAPYRVSITPGNGTVPRGSDQTFTASLSGFTADDAVLLVRKGDATSFERVPMLKGDNGTFEAMIFDLDSRLEFLAEAAGVRSSTFTLEVMDLPYAQRIDLEYHFPAYTGLEPRVVEDAGDIAVLIGTEVRVKVTPTMPTKGGQLTLHESLSVPLSVAEDGSLTGKFVADKDGFYRVAMQGPDGGMITASPQYVIDVLTDMAPTVSIAKPGRDTNATPVEEFFVEARADDDFGVKNLELVYSVNGSAEKVIPLYRGAKRMEEVTAGHTFYMEELGVQAGDAVAYYARAADNDSAGGKQATSDMYFLRVRPFGKDFKPATSMAGGGGGGGGGGGAEVGALSEAQRQIIAATFNTIREKKTMSAEKLRENSVVLALSQGRLREQVEGLVSRMNSRLVAPDPSFQKIAEVLPLAVAEMQAAETKLQQRSPDGAMPSEQKALQYLQQAEEEYETQVQTRNQSGGGGGGQQAGSIAEDLADLFELEMDKMANQYETSSRAQSAEAEQRIDALAEKLKELARRQQQELERQRRRAAGQAASGGGDQQRALAEAAEEAARQLEKLSREQNRPDLANAARQMQQAADAMRRAAAGNDPSAAGQAQAASERLQQAQRQLQGAQADRNERGVQEAMRQAEEIAREHADAAKDAEQLGNAGSDRLQKAQLNAQRREGLSTKLGQLEQQIDRMSNDLARTEKDASRKLQEASGGIRDDKTKEKLRYSRQFLGRDADPGAGAELDADIGSDLMDLRRRLADASGAVGKGGQSADQKENTLERARELVRGVDSLGRRMQERASGQNGQGREQQGREASAQNQQGQQGRQGQQQGQAGQQGQQGQQGQAGQQGQQGQQGQAGQQGQQGQSGQSGQSGQQGQEGQSGQSGQATADDGNGGGGNGDSFGGWDDDGGWGNARPGNFNGDDIRQFRGEARRYGQDLEGLRRALRAEGVDTRDLDEILRRLKSLDDDRVYKDVQELARLQAQVSDGLRRFEFGLRRQLDGESRDVLLSGSDEVPAEFKGLVEEYYRSLARQRGQPR